MRCDGMTAGERVALSLGGNLGDVAATFSWALRRLELGGLADARLSPLYRTAPVDCEPGVPDFVNAAVAGLWPGDVWGLHRLCKRLEEEAGRPAEHGLNSSRTLDIDLILFGGAVIDGGGLRVPHPRAAGRLFVLVPLADVAAGWTVPGDGRTVGELLDVFRGSEALRQLLDGRLG